MGKRTIRTLRLGAGLFAGVVGLTTFFDLPVSAAESAAKSEEGQVLVDKAKATVDGFMAQKEFTWLHANLKNAKGVLIYPQVLKAGFFLGGSGGTGVLLARDEKSGEWSQPAFYTVGSVSFGLQFGGEAAEVVVLVMSQQALDSLYTSAVKLGGATSVAAGPVGLGAEAAVPPAYFISFARAKGLYAGISLEGSVVAVRDTLNEAYYGKAVSPADIVVKMEVSNKGSDELREALKKAAGPGGGA